MSKIEDEIQFLSGKRACFRFRCEACGRCCSKFRIVLSPYDIIRLQRATGRSTQEFIEQGTILIVRESFKKVFGFAPIADLFDLFGLPQTDMVPIAVMGFRGGTVSQPECEFLSVENSHKRLCKIYENRPTMCRLHPLGCITIGGRRRWFFRQPLCEMDSGTEYTVDEWIRESQLGPFLAANARFLQWVRELLEECEKFPAISDDQWQMLGRIWYNFDSIDVGTEHKYRKEINNNRAVPREGNQSDGLSDRFTLSILERMFHEWLDSLRRPNNMID